MPTYVPRAGHCEVFDSAVFVAVRKDKDLYRGEELYPFLQLQRLPNRSPYSSQLLAHLAHSWPYFQLLY